MIEAAKAAGYKKVVGEYLPTKKNGMVADIYPRMGFTEAGGGRFVADTGNFKPLDTFISRRENS